MQKIMLQNVAGFSPFQLVLSSKSNLPSAYSNHLPTLTPKPSSQIIKDNLGTIQGVLSAFIASESDKRMKQALSYNIRTNTEMKYFIGDSVLNKREDSNK